jgi:hypothetical protein
MQERWKKVYSDKFWNVVNKQNRFYDGGYLVSIVKHCEDRMTTQELKICWIHALSGPNATKFGLIADIDHKYS